MKPQIQWIKTRCIGCKTCADVCPEGALSFSDDGIKINRQLCTNCNICSNECPSTALELLGRKWGLEELIEEVEKDRVYFEKSGGGITVSGGDPALQADFAAAFLKGLKEKDINTALDTSGHCLQKTLEMLLPYSDLVLYDIKEIDSSRHKHFTGISNDTILNNLIYLNDYMKSHDVPKDLWIRTPIIPDTTERNDNILGIGNFIASHLDKTIGRWELCSFNNLCRDKYLRLDLDWPFMDIPLMRKSRMEELVSIARKSGADPDIVCWTGPTRLENNSSDIGSEITEKCSVSL
jgi:pyruvate formate lyase activating enzyme